MAKRRRSMMDGFDVSVDSNFGNFKIPNLNKNMRVNKDIGRMPTQSIGFTNDTFEDDLLQNDPRQPEIISDDFDEPDMENTFGSPTIDIAGGFGSLNPVPLTDEDADRTRGGNFRSNSRLIKRRGLRGKFEDTRFKMLSQGGAPLNAIEQVRFTQGRTFLGGGS